MLWFICRRSASLSGDSRWNLPISLPGLKLAFMDLTCLFFLLVHFFCLHKIFNADEIISALFPSARFFLIILFCTWDFWGAGVRVYNHFRLKVPQGDKHMMPSFHNKFVNNFNTLCPWVWCAWFGGSQVVDDVYNVASWDSGSLVEGGGLLQ